MWGLSTGPRHDALKFCTNNQLTHAEGIWCKSWWFGKNLAQNIEAEVKAIGQNSRGCKIRLNSGGTDYYGFIRETACPAVIFEDCFVDNAADVQIADSLKEQKAFGAQLMLKVF